MVAGTNQRLFEKEGKLISHETIYTLIRKDKREGGELYKSCRHALKHRRRAVCGSRSTIPNRTGIEHRPKEADGKRFGDFEMDTIIGKGNKSAIVTIIERSTNMLFMRKLNNGKNAKELAKIVIRLLRPYKGFVKNDYHGQWQRIRLSRNDSRCARYKGVLCRPIRIMAERGGRKRKRTHKTVHSKENCV